MTAPRSILITGATGAIGGALAREYAAPGVTLLLHGRNAGQLEQIAADCRVRGASVIACSVDLGDVMQAREWALDMASRHAVDLLVANAGMNIDIGPDGAGERWEDSEALFALNLRSVVALVDAFVPAMRRRSHGQIVLISSLAGYFGLPVTPSYSASKAAVKAYGEALRGWLGPEGLRVNVVMPGYVESPMCNAMPGPKPFLWTPGRAARTIRRGLERDRARITFPFPLNLGTWFLAALPAGLSVRLVRLFGYHG
ncbi:MAG TPA: SDR family NAD(P)-dependent oxidoreductase [Aromatoleum sp.]|uniref:SDR family NAD(P)-dependent oxidoreductase n=1 Tax=Aromatoleum sp. TaxID=2307007 RepID=UPI002B47053E|nr:SDR family NAD(P)-dependent oxidoreductase [Aromatoleum sp.]HJV25571.1 SDR family NAD(P)-dependent oxidoreductase [Aromatoleum sp.]